MCILRADNKIRVVNINFFIFEIYFSRHAFQTKIEIPYLIIYYMYYLFVVKENTQKSLYTAGHRLNLVENTLASELFRNYHIIATSF